MHRMTRRTFVLGAATPFVVSACQRRPSAAVSANGTAEEFTVRHHGSEVRCLFHDQLISGDREGCLLVVLLHGSGADATQWTDIGLVGAVDGLELSLDSAVHRVVAVAPDIADPAHAPDFVVDTLLPHVDVRFGPGMLAISGISSGAASSLAVARDERSGMGSVGLHSPAIQLRQRISPAPWSCYVDVGDDDPLARHAADTADVLRASGIEVSEHHWPGGHNRSYWRQHLPAYLAFHVDRAEHGSP
jgi:predicted esterase